MDTVFSARRIDWLVVLKIYVALAVFQLYRDFEAGDNQSRNRSCETGNRTRTSCFASQEQNHYTTAAPLGGLTGGHLLEKTIEGMQSIFSLPNFN